MKKIGSLLLMFTLLICLASCDGKKAKRKDPVDYEDEAIELEDDAYDLFNESLINLMEEGAYDLSVKADITQNDNPSTVEMAYQFSDDGTDCKYYSHENMGGMLSTDTYYANGQKVTVTTIALIDHETVTADEMDRETFLEETGNPATILATVNVPRDVFDGAEIVTADGITTVSIIIGGITGLPDQMAGIANTLFDLEHAENVVYDTATFTLTMTEDAELKSIRLQSGMDYTDAHGTDVAVNLDLLATINATSDDVQVKAFEGEIPAPEDPQEKPSFDISDFYDLIPEKYRDMIPA